MLARILADLLVLIHLGFILFVVLGGLWVLRHPRLAWLHLPAAVWGVLIEWMGWICPLTPWEIRLRAAAGQQGYEGSFTEHYLLPVIYPAELTPTLQWILGGVVLLINAAVYGRLLWRRRRRLASDSREGHDAVGEPFRKRPPRKEESR